MKHGDLVTCACGWVSFAVSRAFALSAIREFQTYYDSLTPREQTMYYGSQPATEASYACTVCGKNDSFRSYNETTDVNISRCTINPVIVLDTDAEA